MYYPDKSLFHGSVPLIMGTRFEFLCCPIGKADAEQLWKRIGDMLQLEHGLFNRFSEDSLVGKINAGVAAPNRELTEVMERCERYRLLTEGLFDVRKGAQELDFGGFAKGYAVKLAGEFCKDAGVDSALIDFGGSTIFGLGHHPAGDCWKIDVRDPFNGSRIGTVSLRDSALSVSGNSPGYSGHIVNPLSGEAENSKKLVAVWGPDPETAEILSTALMIADKDRRELIASRFEEYEFEVFENGR